jgi:hypothetical protein
VSSFTEKTTTGLSSIGARVGLREPCEGGPSRCSDRIVGLVLSGSRGDGPFARSNSDWDVRLIVRDEAWAEVESLFGTPHGAMVEAVIFSLTDFESAGEIGAADEWDRYSYTHARVVLDKLDGRIGELVAAKRTLPAGAAGDRGTDARQLHQRLLLISEEPRPWLDDRGPPRCRRVGATFPHCTVCDARARASVQQVPAVGAGTASARRSCLGCGDASPTPSEDHRHGRSR